MDKKWQSRLKVAFLVIVIAYAIWLAMLIAGYQPYECAAQGKAQGDACDFLSFAGLPARIIVRFTERYDKFFGVVGALAVAGFTFTLWRATSGLKDSTDKLWDAGEAQSAISKQIATATEQQVAILALQTDIQKKQHAVGRLQFLAQHRPKIVIRAIRGPEQRDYFAKALAGDIDQERKWLFLILVNAGGSDADITQFVADYRPITDADRDSLDPLPVGTALVTPPVPVTLKVGEQRVFEITSGSMRSGTAYVGDEVVSGSISYTDGANIERVTAFSRTRSRIDGKFTASDDPEKEYAD